MKLTIHKVMTIELWIEKKSSLDAPVGTEGNSQLSDFIKSTGYTNSEHKIELFFKHERILELLESVNEREKETLNLRFGISNGKTYTLAEIAGKFKVSRERVRQIEESALKKLRCYIKTQQEEKI